MRLQTFRGGMSGTGSGRDYAAFCPQCTRWWRTTQRTTTRRSSTTRCTTNWTSSAACTTSRTSTSTCSVSSASGSFPTFLICQKRLNSYLLSNYVFLYGMTICTYSMKYVMAVLLPSTRYTYRCDPEWSYRHLETNCPCYQLPTRPLPSKIRLFPDSFT